MNLIPKKSPSREESSNTKNTDTAERKQMSSKKLKISNSRLKKLCLNACQDHKDTAKEFPSAQIRDRISQTALMIWIG